jgi:hypothetical protein
MIAEAGSFPVKSREPFSRELLRKFDKIFRFWPALNLALIGRAPWRDALPAACR